MNNSHAPLPSWPGLKRATFCCTSWGMAGRRRRRGRGASSWAASSSDRCAYVERLMLINTRQWLSGISSIVCQLQCGLLGTLPRLMYRYRFSRGVRSTRRAHKRSKKEAGTPGNPHASKLSWGTKPPNSRHASTVKKCTRRVATRTAICRRDTLAIVAGCAVRPPTRCVAWACRRCARSGSRLWHPAHTRCARHPARDAR